MDMNMFSSKGETLVHVAFAINYLASLKGFRPGERVIVIGSGNSAMNRPRTAIRNGAPRFGL